MLSKYGILCKVAEAGSFTRVAEEIGYSQSAVSQSVKALEQELNCVLFHRQKSGLTLTRDGAAYLPYLQSIYAAERALEQKYREVQGLENSTVYIGTFSSVSHHLLPRLMQAFRAQHPGIRFFLLQGNYEEIRDWILDGTIDFGFISSDATNRVEVQPLFRDDYLAVLPASHPLAAQEEVTLAQLTAYPFLLMNDTMILQAFRAKKLTPQTAFCLTDDHVILGMVRSGMGITILSSLMLSGEEPDLAARPIRESMGRVLSLAWRDRQTMSRAARTFVDFVRAHAEELRRTP